MSHSLKESCSAIEAWFRQQWKQTLPPIYGSMDIRNAGFKLAQVDTNLFPAGFNNLDPKGMPLYVQAMQATIAEICPDISKILLIPENHTRNLPYYESVAVLQDIFSQAGFEVRIGSLNNEITETKEYLLPSNRAIKLEPLVRKGNSLVIDNFKSCCIILNNDLSSGVPEILKNLDQKILPPTHLGWFKRLKSTHFGHYQTICQQFAEMLRLDPWLINPYFEQCANVDFQTPEQLKILVERAGFLLEKIKLKYQEYHIQHQPFLVIKADQGTYGMAVMMIDEPEQLLHLNRKQKQKMAATKGGQIVNKVIIQEGVHTFETAGPEQNVAEPVIYTVGRHVIGGFYRVHKERGPRENLNSPGMDFLPLPLEKHCHIANCQDAPSRFYAYGVIARLALLAAARELKDDVAG
ncbi:MAG: glutamate--cysteine ligase [Proteobacteria bacterium]|nr:glutamate--cysteine ligase [Pseudomonadota bacterium]